MLDIKQVGTHIKAIRKKCNISQEQLAEMTNLNQRTILRVENGQTLPTLDTLNKIAEKLDCNILDFLSISKSREEILEYINRKLNTFTDDELKKFYISFYQI
ncbi:helix-turn-helix transcriptional regulator [bacterium]|nr:helix-turn-helix transcriptional regulator [bacterium]